ncbi:MAG: DUF3540 domain-containing protein [Deltaproteobacteria bacterium]|jgi:hypothetical protein|nr:DUF3540 domain-containing protein [Deltaproteobacteria bacterium]
MEAVFAKTANLGGLYRGQVIDAPILSPLHPHNDAHNDAHNDNHNDNHGEYHHDAHNVTHNGAGHSPIIVAVLDQILEANVAASCFLAPQLGDEVLVFLDDSPAIILSVLKLADPFKEAVCPLPNRAKLTSLELTISSKHLATNVNTATVKANEISVKSRLLKTSFGLVRSVANIVNRAANSFLGRYGDLNLISQRSTAIESKRLKLTAKDDLTARTDNLDIKAQGSVLIDGRTLRLG